MCSGRRKIRQRKLIDTAEKSGNGQWKEARMGRQTEGKQIREQ
jgi:hypothetical protein